MKEDFELITLGDSILDSGRYNRFGLNPGRLIVRNSAALFPRFIRHDLSHKYRVGLRHRAQDGATVTSLRRQAHGIEAASRRQAAIMTIGGNDLLTGLLADEGGVATSIFAYELETFLAAFPVRPVFVGNVYDPSFDGEDPAWAGFLAKAGGADALRPQHRRVNEVIAEVVADTRGAYLVDLYGHFLAHGNPSWYSHRIEPSWRGCGEVRRVFLEKMESEGAA